jgi:predicted transcriptional regulator
MQTNQSRVNIIVQTSPELRDRLHALARAEGECMSVILRKLIADAVRARAAAVPRDAMAIAGRP